MKTHWKPSIQDKVDAELVAAAWRSRMSYLDYSKSIPNPIPEGLFDSYYNCFNIMEELKDENKN